MQNELDPFDLDRFIEAQADIYSTVCDELGAGRKRSHWMWFIFPQMKGLGASAMSQHYGIGSLAEARAYLAHPVLGDRLAHVTRLMMGHQGRMLPDILGSTDAMKFRSSMTLFASAAGPDSPYAKALDVFCGGQGDERTLSLLEAIGG